MHSPAFLSRVLVTLTLTSILATPLLRAVETDVTAIYAATANDYQRVRGADGRFAAETYAFADGGRIDGTYADDSLGTLTFPNVARTVAGALASQNYVPARRAAETKLMVVLFWGATMGADAGQYSQQMPGVTTAINDWKAFGNGRGYMNRLALNGLPRGLPDSFNSTEGAMEVAAISNLEMAAMMNQSANAMRDRNNRRNAAITGFYEEYLKTVDLPAFGLSESIREELEADRYFVVLKAYDFQALRKNKQKVLLWETRFSVRQRNNRFDRVLPVMAQNASKYFGQQSGRLLREVIPVGRVDIGTPTVVQTSAEK